MAKRAVAIVMTVLSLAGCEAALRDEQFVIYAHGDVDAAQVARIREEFGAGLTALRKLPIDLREDRLPITVHLDSARGISNASGGSGPINFFGVGRRRVAVVHELTHVLTGYRSLGGDAHWSAEGFASYMQDKHGSRSFPTQKRPHELAQLIIRRGHEIPMMELLRARNRTSYFRLARDLWTGWRAYALSTSFTHYLIDNYGMAKFIRLYQKRGSFDQPGEIQVIYGEPATALIARWRQLVTSSNTRGGAAERIFNRYVRAFR